MKKPGCRALAAAAAAGVFLTGCTDMGWLPPNLNGAYGDTVDELYYKIMVVVAVTFFLTEGLLIYSIVRFRAASGRRAIYSHGSKKTELLWSIVPGFILLWLALVQKDAWFHIKSEFPKESEAVAVQVMPEQFAWNFRYPGADGAFGTEDDLLELNNLHVPVGKNVVTRMSSKDVIHSFFIPLLRVKQDVLPGMMTRAWFRADKIAVWNLKTHKIEYLTLADFDARKVAFPASTDRAGFVGPRYGVRNAATGVFIPNDQPGGKRKNGARDIDYEPPRDKEGGTAVGKKIPIAHRGKIEDRPWEEAEYVHHPLDLACAELCGLQHYRMRGMVWVEPEYLFRNWLEERERSRAQYLEEYGESPFLAAPKWQKVWDGIHAEYNGAFR
ncbi:MAG: cytochrome c oxidase subunit II [Planctomycetes bacterium]|nr:cytochrome c oxidase subunit II [Planctomycetota bacterium]